MSSLLNSLKNLASGSKYPGEDTNMRFSPSPVPGDSGFNQWRDAMKMVSKLPGGIPPEFRKKLWLALAEKHLQSKGVNWSQTEKLCFNEWSNPDDSELGIQIVKDLHRTGCSLFCGAAGQENQALLKRVLLAYARWNKSVGYCQGFNMLAALILQVMDKNETDSVKVMIYLIEGVLPESYFANNLRGLSVDMIVFRDLLKIRLPLLSKHLEALQNDAREGNSYEPPLTNVFTMQWFLTLFCNCLPQATVLRVWDLIFLEGNEILLRTAIAIWERLSDRILAVNSADEFYSIMGVLTREMLEFGLVDSNTLIKSIVAIGACTELNEMRDKYLYNITPWTQSVQTVAKKGFKLFYSDDDEVESDYDEKAAVTAAYGISIGRKRDKNLQNSKETNIIQPYAHGHPDRERLALDISALKKQYAKLRERQRQAHIILQAACARQPMGQNSTPGPIAMNHLLLGKNAILNSRGRRLGPPKGSIPPARTKEVVKKKQSAPAGETILWKDTEKFRRRQSMSDDTESSETFIPDSDSSSYSEDDASSTSTELCDEENNRLSDFDTEEKNSDVLDDKVANKKSENSDICGEISKFNLEEENNCEEIQSDIKKLISNIDNLKISDDPENTSDVSDLKISELAIDSDGIIRDTDINLESILEIPNMLAENLIEISPKNERIIFEDKLEATPEIDITNVNVFINSNPTIGDNLDKITENSLKEETFQNEEDIFEIFLQERVKLSKENSVESLTSPKDLPNLKLPDEKLRRHKSCEETPINHSEKSIFKQKSFDINALPTIETSLWTPYQIEEEVEEKQTVENTHKKLTKQTSADFLTIEDKRLEAGRRNSERALKIIQENSLILHRILVQQKSSDPDSEEEMSRSPISKTFLRSESLLSKDEKTDEERSSKDGEEELESGVESFSVSPALLDEESDKSLKKEFYNENEKLIISKIDENSTKVDTQYEFKYQTSSEKSSFETLQPNISSLQEGTEIDKNISNVLEICTEANKENMSDKSSNTSDIKNILTFPVSEHNISPLTPDDKKLGASSNNFEVYSVCKNDFKESVNIDTSIPSIPIVKQLDMSPITSEDINISNVLEVTGETHDFENNSSQRSQIQELLMIDSGSTEELQDSKSVNNVFPTSVHYNLSPITPDNKNITNIGETSFETNENTRMFTNSPSSGSKEPYCSYKQYSSLITPEEPNLSNTEATKTFENTELTTSQEQTNFQSISSITSSEQYIFTNITPEDIADKETRILDDESEPKFNQDESSKNFAVLTSKYSCISPITPKDINTLDRISFPSDITIFDDTWKLNIDQKESPDDKFNISTYSSSKQYTFSPITPIYTNALNFILSPSEISQKTELIDPLMEPEVDQNDKNVITNIPIYSSSKKYKISPITPTNAFIPTHNQIDGKSSICDEEFTTKKLFEKSSDINTSLFSVSKQFDISPISPEGALKTLDYKNMTFTTQIDNTYYLEEYFDSGNRTTRSITPLDETNAGSSYKFSYKFTDDSPDIETNTFKSDSSETIPNISSITSTNNQEISGLKDSPDYSNYPKSDKLTESSINLSLYEELKDDIQFKMDNTSENFSPYKYKFREDSDESIKQNKTKPQIDSPSVSATKIYSFDSSIESTSQFSTTFMDESTKFKPEDSKFTFKSHLDSPEYYSKSSLSKPELKPVIYSPDDVSPTKTNNNGISVPTIYSPDDIQSTKTKSFDSSLPGKSEDFESISKTPDNNYLSSGQETKYDRTKLSINLDPRRYSNISPEISPPKHLSCLQFTSFQADIPCTSKAIQFSPICTKEKDVSPKSPKSSKYLFNLPTLSPPRRTMKSPLSPNRTFSPFPVQPIARQPKELGVKLGLYRDLNSPNK